MNTKLVPDELWKVIQTVLPPRRLKNGKKKPGRPRSSDRRALTGIIFVLKTGIPWKELPRELRCGSHMAPYRRLRMWQTEGIWDKILKVLLEHLHQADLINWERAALDSSSIQAKRGAKKQAPAR